MICIAVVEDKEQALVAHDVGIVAILRVVAAVFVHIHKGSQVFGIAFRTVGRPGQDVLRNFISGLSVVADEVIDLSPSEVPDVLKLLFHRVGGCGCSKGERSHPIVTTDLIISVGSQMEIAAFIHSADPE